MTEDIDDLLVMLASLGHPARLVIFKAIARIGSPTRAEIALDTGYVNTAWHHLNILVTGRAVLKDDLDPKDVRYRINKEGIKELIELLGEFT